MHQLTDAQAVRRLESLLAVEREERARLQRELDLRNCALDAARTHFMIVDVCNPRWNIVYANRAIAQDHGYEASELMGRSPQHFAHSSFDILAALVIGHSLAPADDASAFGAQLPPDPKIDESYLIAVKAPIDWTEATRRITEITDSPEIAL